jgi:hypothetical protein
MIICVEIGTAWDRIKNKYNKSRDFTAHTSTQEYLDLYRDRDWLRGQFPYTTVDKYTACVNYSVQC